MKTQIKLCIMLSIFLAVFGLSFASTHTIGTGTGNQINVPVNGNSTYSWTKVLYTANEVANAGITESGFINSISYNVTGGTNNYVFTNQEIYMYHSSKNSFQTMQDRLISIMNPDHLVYSGSITYPASGWHEIQLDDPFLYDGVSGIEIVYINLRGNWLYGYPRFRSTNISNMAVYFEDEEPREQGWCNYSNSRPNTRFEFMEISNDPQLTVDPLSLDFGTMLFGTEKDAQNVKVSNLGNGTLNLSASDVSLNGTHADLFTIDTTVFPIALEMQEEALIPVSFIGNASGNIAVDLEISYAGETTTVALTAIVLGEGTSYVDIGTGTTAERFPFGANYGYERSVSIYTLDEIGEAGMIEGIGWNVSTTATTAIPYKVYLGVTGAEQQTSKYFADVIADMTLVSQGSYSFNETGWNTIIFNQPYFFAGGNLIVAVESNMGGNGSTNRPSFYYTSATAKHQRWQNNNYVPAGMGTVEATRPNIRLQRSDLPQEELISVSPSSLDFGTLKFGVQSTTKLVNIRNTGGLNVTIDASNLNMTGEHAGMFGYDASTLPITMEPGASHNLPVYVHSSVDGDISANLVVSNATQSFSVSLSANVWPQGVSVLTIGTGMNANNASGGIPPYRGYFKNFRMQNLVKAAEITAAGGEAGFIDAISYEVQSPNNYAPMANYRIRIKHTSSESLNSVFETGTFVEVFQSDDYVPTAGWSIHEFDTPFLWDGTSNIIIETVTDMTPSYSQNASVYYNTLGFDCTVSYANDTQIAANSSSGLATTQRPNMKFTMSVEDTTDYIARPNTPADLGDDANVTIVGGGFVGAVKLSVEDDDLTAIPNPAFITLSHQVWQLIGTGTVTLTFQNDSAEDMWFTYVVGGAWVAVELPAGISEEITINLDAKDADFEFALGKGGNPTLPVELSYFNAIYLANENYVKLSWKTESESQMLGYQIYRNTDANLATANLITGKIVDASNSSTGDSYSFLDDDIQNGTYYYWLEAVSYSSSDFYGYQTVLVDIVSTPELPEISTMSNAYPNPFKDATAIDLAIKAGETGTLTIYNMLGQAVFTQKMGEGNITINWNGMDRSGNRCGSGVYFYKLTTPTKSETKKMVIMK